MLEKMLIYKVEKNVIKIFFFFFTVFFGIGGWENQTGGTDCIFNFIPWQCFRSLRATAETNR